MAPLEANSQNRGWWSTGLDTRRRRGASAVCPGSRSKISSETVTARLRSTISSVAASSCSNSPGGMYDSTSRYPFFW